MYQDNLESKRIITRKLTNEDASLWAEFFADKESVEYFPPSGLSTNLEQATNWVNKQLDRYATNRFGLQVLIDKQTNQFVGQCGLLMQEVDGVIELEVGYHVFKKYRGQGYAPEAAKLFIDYAFKNNLADSVISIIDIRNIRSQRVAEKNNLIKQKQTKWSDLDVYIYRINKSVKYL